MLSPKTLLTALTVTTAVAAGAPGAHAAGRAPGTVDFGDHLYGYVSMTQTTTWDQPADATSYDDCYHHYTGSAKGSDTIKVTTKSTRLTLLPALGEPIVEYGGDRTPASGMDATVHRTRSTSSTKSVEPGPCGGSGEMEIPALYNCAPIRYAATVSLAFADGKVSPRLGGAKDASADTSWSNCPVITPSSAPDGENVNDAPEKVDPKALDLKPGKRLVLKGGKSWSESLRGSTATTRVTWTIRLLGLK